MVESENGTLLWDAVVVDTSKDSTGGVNGYFVHFKGWSSRFDCWVPCHRVVEANPANLEIQVSIPLFQLVTTIVPSFINLFKCSSNL